jgi:hypothetical protein
VRGEDQHMLQGGHPKDGRHLPSKKSSVESEPPIVADPVAILKHEHPAQSEHTIQRQKKQQCPAIPDVGGSGVQNAAPGWRACQPPKVEPQWGMDKIMRDRRVRIKTSANW